MIIAISPRLRNTHETFKLNDSQKEERKERETNCEHLDSFCALYFRLLFESR